MEHGNSRIPRFAIDGTWIGAATGTRRADGSTEAPLKQQKPRHEKIHSYRNDHNSQNEGMKERMPLWGKRRQGFDADGNQRKYRHPREDRPDMN